MKVGTVRGRRIVLREPIPELDGPLRTAWFDADKEGVRTLFVDEQPQRDQIARIREELADPNRWVWTVEAAGRPVGYVQLSKKPDDNDAAVAYYIAPDDRERGYATEAVEFVIEAANSLRIYWLKARIVSTNPASIGVVKRNGFDFWGDVKAPSGEPMQVWIRLELPASTP